MKKTAMKIRLKRAISRAFALTSFMLSGLAAFADPSVAEVTARQRYPWNGLVDVSFTVIGEAGMDHTVSFAATNVSEGTGLTMKTLLDNKGAALTSREVKPGTYRWVWNAAADLPDGFTCDRVTVTGTAVPIGGVQLWENGPYWAEFNVGATKPEEYGYYFWWGDTVGYRRNAANNGWVSVKDGAAFSFSSGNCPTFGKDNPALQSAGYVDATGNLVADHDAATVHLGDHWRLPTDADFAALESNCTTIWTTRGGVSGRLITGKGAYASKSIFLPAAGGGYNSLFSDVGTYGYYWSSTLSSWSQDAWYFDFGSSDFHRNHDFRNCGQSVRPLRDAVQNAGFAVHYNSNGGSGTMADDVFAYGGAKALATNVFEHTGYIFEGWSTSADGVVQFQDGQVVSNLTRIANATVNLHAVWKKAVPSGVQLWENGPYWAEFNVGATKPEEYGYYFWWGDTVGYRRNAAGDGWVSVKDGAAFSFSDANCPTYGKDNSELQSAGYIDSTGNLVAAHDAATVHLGAPWRMPTDAEVAALISNCTTTWITTNGVNGRLFTGKGAYASRSIFLPAVGGGSGLYLYGSGSGGGFWSSSPYSVYSYYAWDLGFDSGNFGRYYSDRGIGRSVRPLRGYAQ